MLLLSLVIVNIRGLFFPLLRQKINIPFISHLLDIFWGIFEENIIKNNWYTFPFAVDICISAKGKPTVLS